MSAQRPGDCLHRLKAAAHGLPAPEVQVLAGPVRGVVLPELLEIFLEQVGADRRQVVAEQFAEADLLFAREMFFPLEYVYWIPVYDILEQHGFDVWLVNARETRNLPGRKSDVQESQWLLKLHTYGLLRKSFRPPAEIRAIRSCWRERGEYVQQAGVSVQRLQKSLDANECAVIHGYPR